MLRADFYRGDTTCQNLNLSHWWVYVLCAATLNNNKTATVGRDDGVHGAEHCAGYIGDSLSLASVSDQTCYSTLLSYSSGLSSCYDHSPQSDSVTYLQQVRE